MNRNAVQAITLIDFDVSTITGNYDYVGTLPEACYYLKIWNHSNRDLMVSYDGVNDHEALPQDFLFEVPAGTMTSNNFGLFPRGMKFYVNGVVGAGPSGDVYISAYYLKQV